MKNYTTTLGLISILLFGFQLANAQQRGQRPGGREGRPVVKISGTVFDEQSEKPLEYATATLFSMRDSSIVTGGISNAEGVFNLDARPGRFYLKVEFISYESKTIENIGIKRGVLSHDLGMIHLNQSAEILDVVEVRAERSEMQITLDKRVFNVGKDLANKGGSAEDLLDNVPSVSVDIEGVVSLRGSEDVRILIDGKPSGLVGLGNSNGLRQIPSNMIDKVEVITNPSARYEAEGMTGIINIVLRKDKKVGLNGSFDFSAGYPDKYGAAINLNYRKKDLNFFVNYGINYRKSPGQGILYQEFYKNDTTFILDETRDFTRGGLSHSLRLGSNYYLNKKNTLTASFLYRISDRDNKNETIYNDYINDYPSNFIERTIRTDEEIESGDVTRYALNYSKIFDNKKHLLTMDVQFEQNAESENSDFLEQYFGLEGQPTGAADLFQRSSNDEGSSRLLFKIDYVKPISKEGKFEIGGQSSFRQIDNDYLVEEFVDNDWQTLIGVSNNFDYNENIHAIYASYGDKIGKFSFLAGLRGEYSEVNTELEQTQEVNNRDYFNLFPTVHLTYDLGNENAMQLSYSRRTRRPRFRHLNPFFTYSDARNFFSGNPNLNPQFTHSIEIGHLKYWDKASISSAIYYRHTDGLMQRIKTINEDGTTITRPENLSTEDAYGAEFTFSYRPAKWMSLNGDLNFYRSIVDGTNQGASLESDNFSWFGRLTSKFTLLKATDFQLRFNYRAPRETTQGSRKAMAYVNLGISRDVLKKKGTLTLSANDLFNSRKRSYSAFGDNFLSEGEFQWRSRSITLNFNYRLNQKKKRSRNRENREGGGEEEVF